MEKLINDFLAQKRFIVAGSFRNESKYAYRILKMLEARGYTVYPVHPTIKEVDGQRCYSSVTDVPYEVDVVNLVTPPAVTELILAECKDKGIKKIWLQPGAENENAIQYCKDNNMEVAYQVCVMMEAV